MNFTLLAPIAGLIAAAIALPVLLLFYLLKLRRRPVRISSTLLWEQAIRDLQVNTPFRWLRASWLLLLQLLALLLLLLAIARPAVSDGDQPRGRVIILIDCSASMSARDMPGARAGAEPVTRLAYAQQRAVELIDRLGARSVSANDSAPGARAMVIAFASEARAVIGDSADRAALREAVRTIEPTDQPADLDSALRLVEAYVAGGDESTTTAPPRVVILSDGYLPRSADSRPPMLGAAEVRFVRCGPAATAGVAPARVNAADGAPDLTAAPVRTNAGIAAISARRDYDDPARVRVFVRIVGAFDRPVNVPLVCTLNGQTIGAAAVELPALSAAPVAAPALTDNAAVAPGEPAASGTSEAAPRVTSASHIFELENTDGGTVLVRIGTPDALAADDAAAIVLAPSRPLRVLIVHAPGVDDLSLGLLGDAIGAMDRVEVRRADLAQYERLAGDSGAEGLLGTTDLVVFDRARPTRAPALPGLWVGVAPPIPGVEMADYAEADTGGRPTPIVYWQRAHPLMRHVSPSAVRVLAPRRLLLPSDEAPDGASAPAPDNAPGDAAGSPVLTSGAPAAAGSSASRLAVRAEVIASGVAGPLVALVEDRGVRHAVLAFELAASTWWRDRGFPVFIANAVQTLSGTSEESAGQWFSTRQPVAIAAASPIAVTGPGGFQLSAEPGLDGRAALGVLTRAGVYTARDASGDETAIAVNLCDAGESSLQTRDAVLVTGEPTQAGGLNAAAPREVWHWFVLAAVLLLSVEWVVFARKARV